MFYPIPINPYPSQIMPIHISPKYQSQISILQLKSCNVRFAYPAFNQHLFYANLLPPSRNAHSSAASHPRTLHLWSSASAAALHRSGRCAAARRPATRNVPRKRPVRNDQMAAWLEKVPIFWDFGTKTVESSWMTRVGFIFQHTWE